MMTAATTALKALIVEDDPDAAEVLSRALEAGGFEPECAMSVGAALVKLERGLTPAAAIIDMRLPDGSGGVILWRIRRRDPNIPIAVVTGMADAASHPEIVREPPDIIFQKPVDLNALVDWLKSVT
jgi:ActR/RegA family two-component response regulator